MLGFEDLFLQLLNSVAGEIWILQIIFCKTSYFTNILFQLFVYKSVTSSSVNNRPCSLSQLSSPPSTTLTVLFWPEFLNNKATDYAL